MSRFTFIIVPGNRAASRKFSLSRRTVQSFFLLGLLMIAFGSYAVADYIQLRALRTNYITALQENRSIRGEARILMSNRLTDTRSR